MASLLFRILLLPLLLGTCSSNTQHITIRVSDIGRDDPSCMQNGGTCKTLSYVLDELSTASFNQSTVITVHITCNQTIANYSQRYLSPQHFLSVSIIGHNKSCITLYSSMSLTIAREAISNDTNWAWIGLVFISGTDYTIDLKIRHINLLNH